MNFKTFKIWGSLVIVFLILFPFGLNLLANHLRIISQANFGDWLGFMGSYIGGIISGVATFATVIFAIYQLQTQQANAALNELKSQENEKRFQANKIAAWIDSENRRSQMLYSIQNSSDLPIYQAIITLVSIQGAGPPRNGDEVGGDYKYRVLLVTIPPGKFYTVSDSNGKGMHIEYGVEVAFTDAKGIHWVRKSNGQLKEIKKRPLEFYDIPLPVSWSKVNSEKPDYFTQNE
ncbi:hypothetical protein P8881_21635 [Bacillus haynesii]|nr:hypothetical protein [Bacillus haynesii]MEC0739005.1 hypothetical protein [Bacillus haynesii]